MRRRSGHPAGNVLFQGFLTLLVWFQELVFSGNEEAALAGLHVHHALPEEHEADRISTASGSVDRWRTVRLG